MKQRPLYHFWPLFLALPAFLGFAVYNLYSAVIDGGLVGSKYGNGWVTLSDQPYSFWFAVIIYIGMVIIFGGGLVKVMQYVLMRLRHARRE